MDFILCEVGTKCPCIVCKYRGLAMDEMILGWPATAECWLRLKRSPWWICGGRSGNETDFW